jgi:hypothetical protein
MMPPFAGSAVFYRGTGVRNLAKVVGKDATQCGCCGRSRADAGSLMKCGRCKQVSYCNVDCQKADWKTHKPVCK